MSRPFARLLPSAAPVTADLDLGADLEGIPRDTTPHERVWRFRLRSSTLPLAVGFLTSTWIRRAD